MEEFNIKEVKVRRTLEGTLFEVAFLILAIVVWAFVIWAVNRAPDIVPTHFGLDGHVDAYGSPKSFLIPCVILTGAGALLLVGAYFPRFVNVPGGISNLNQCVLAIRMMRILSIMMLLLVFSITLSSLVLSSHSPFPVIMTTVCIVAVALLFTFLIFRAK